MRSPRRLLLDKRMLQKNNISTDPPSPDSLFWKMWNECESIAYDAFNTDFIQGIGKGTLDPIKYGAFYVSDGFYCFNGRDCYGAAVCRADDKGLHDFLKGKYESYVSFDNDFSKTWHIREASGIIPIDVCKEYSNYETTITSHEDVIYTIALMLPCEYLWPWLASQLPSPQSSNVYAKWITENSDLQNAYAMGNYLEQYRADHPGEIDDNRAIEIYRQAMTFEYRNFAAATL